MSANVLDRIATRTVKMSVLLRQAYVLATGQGWCAAQRQRARTTYERDEGQTYTMTTGPKKGWKLVA